MTPERWQKIRDVLQQALELAPEKRSRFLDLACGSDKLLRQDVQSFLSADGHAPPGFLESPPFRASSLTTGAKLGDYEIVSELGAGGMGVVYRARDLRLGRSVAIKVLRGHLWADADRLRRFEQEAQAAAALNHPNILSVYQLGVYDRAPYLVSEFLEGATLREELRKGPLRRSRVLDLAEQITDGLSAAHQRGIIHRDLKPENLYVSKEGRVKILDFGLAKLMQEEQDNGATLGSQTLAGGIAGTVGYTSPEQVRGEKLDSRSDLFSLGVVFYEMSTGERPFSGATSGMTFEAILNREPEPPSRRNRRVPAELERIITKALEKDREVRYQTAAEIRVDLKRLKRDMDSRRDISSPDLLRFRSGRGTLRRVWRKAMTPVLLVIVLSTWLVYRESKSLLPNVSRQLDPNVRAEITAPPTTSFRLTGDNAGAPVISPNGDYVAFAATAKDGRFKLWLRGLDSVEARALPDTEGAFFPFWSPNSKSLAFFADGKLKIIDINQGSPVTLCDAPDARGGTWSAKGDIVFTPTPTAGLVTVKATGGVPKPLTHLDDTKYTSYRWPFFLPDNTHFIYYAANHEPSISHENAIYYASLDGRENRMLFHSDTNAVFANGHLLFAAGNNLLAQSFNFKTGELTGQPILVASRAVNDSVTWHADVSTSETGILLYGATGSGSRQLVWLDSTSYQPAEVAVDGLSQLFLARLSPQGDRIVLQKDKEGHDLSVFSLLDKTTEASFPKEQGDGFPAWSPDGKWIAYSSFRDGRYGIYRISSDGNGNEEEVLRDDVRIMPVDWTGNNLLYVRGALGNEFQCWTISLASKQKRKVLDKVDDCRVSPNGLWLAYAAFESMVPGESHSRLKVYVTDFATGKSRYQVSEDSGLGPQWSHDGKGIYFLEQGTLALVHMEVRFRDEAPHYRLLNKSIPNVLAEPIYAVSPDGHRILIEQLPKPIVIVITNLPHVLEKE